VCDGIENADEYECRNDADWIVEECPKRGLWVQLTYNGADEEHDEKARQKHQL